MKELLRFCRSSFAFIENIVKGYVVADDKLREVNARLDMEKLKDKLENYNKALARLVEASQEPEPNAYVYDAVVKRFEFVYELAWRLMKALIEYKGGGEPKFPRDVFREAFTGGIITDGEIWLAMMKDRNLTSHTYDDMHAKEVYTRVKDSYIAHYEDLANYLQGEIDDAARNK